MKKINSTKFVLLSLFLVTLIISYTGCSEKTEPVTRDSYYMDTICKISIYDMEEMSEENADKAINGAFRLCGEYENLISSSREGSDIYKINESNGEGILCDDRTIEVLKLGIEAGELSKGRFDITVGHLTDLWDFHGDNPKVPSDKEIKECLEGIDYRKITIDGNMVSKGDSKGKINLGGIGKGYIADKATEYLEEQGVTSGIVDFGGDIVVIGNKAGEKFKIGVETPYSDRSEMIGYFETEDSTFVTSGIYERFFEVDGKQYHHIIDLNTGYPADTDVVSVTISGEKGQSGRCDGLSTICLLLGSEEGVELIESLDNVEAVFQLKDGSLVKTSGVNGFVESK